MYLSRSKKNPYTKQTVFDILSVIAGIAVIATGIWSFADPDGHSWMFPIIFFLAALFQILLAIPRVSAGYGNFGRKESRQKAAGVGLFCVAGLFVILAAVSAICLWR
jgi:quinol-cytochrome oxidoreductase complex cytochrome b subunit